MKMKDQNGNICQKVKLNTNLLAKKWQIEPGFYEIELDNNFKHKITPLQKINKKETIANIEDLLLSIYYAAKGYQDCQIPIKEFNKIMACFEDFHSKQPITDVYFSPNLTIRF